MVLGLMSDLHGNVTALRAVVDDGEAHGVDRWWVLGDLVALGPDPVGVLEIVTALPNVEVISGNTERYVTAGDRPFPSLDDIRRDPDLLERLLEVEASFAWTRGAITQAGWLDYLGSLPSELRIELPDGTRVLGVHASPAADDGPGIDNQISDEDLGLLLGDCDADIVFGGHTHDATDRLVAGTRAVNLGSVSNPRRGDRCATYVLVHTEADAHRIEHRVIDYDHGVELEVLDRVRHPGARYIRGFHT